MSEYIDPAEVHPNLRGKYETLSELAKNPRDMLADYPILNTLLITQLRFLARRPLVLAYNVTPGQKSLLSLAWNEFGEVGETITRSYLKREAVDGKASMEGVDTLWFASLHVGLAESGIGKDSRLDRAQVVAMLGLLRQMQCLWSGFRPEGAIAMVETKNNINYPEGVLTAPDKMESSLMVEMYSRSMRPALKGLRVLFDERLLPKDVSMALNQPDVPLPTIYGNLEMHNAYEKVRSVQRVIWSAA